MRLPEAAPNQIALNQNAGASPLSTDPSRRIHRLLIPPLLAAAVAIRFLFLAQKPFWFDECFSVELARLNWSKFLRVLWWREANMSLYYLLLRIWLSFRAPSGQSEFLIRSLSAVISAATLPAIYWLTRQLYGGGSHSGRISLIAATLFAFNAYSVRYAQEARSYALFLLLATLSTGFLFAFLRNPSRRNRLGYIIVSILAVYAHFYALLLLATHWVTLRWQGRDSAPTDRSPEQFSAQLRRAWIIIGIAVLPLLAFVAKTGAGPIRWIHRPGLLDLLEFYEHLSGSNHWPLCAIFAVSGIAAVAPLGKLWSRGSFREESLDPSADLSGDVGRSRFLLLWLFFPVVLTALLSLIRPVFLARYMIFCLPPLLILAAGGLARLRQMWLLTIVLAGILLLSGQGVSFVYVHDFDDERDAVGAATNFILDHAQPGDAIIFHIAAARVPYEFYRTLRAGQDTASPTFRGQLGPEISFPSHGAGLDYRDFTGKPTADLLRTAALTHPRMWVVLMNNGPAGKPDPTTVMLTNTLTEWFPKVLRWPYTRVEVLLCSK